MQDTDTTTIRTTRFGDISIPKDKAIEIIGGVLGFPASSHYAMLDHEEESPFKWLQSLDEPDVAFVVTDPMIFFPEYVVHFRKEELTGLRIENEADVVVFVILSLHGQINEMTANLQGPLIINAKNRSGRQLVLKDALYRTKHRLFPEIA